MRHDKTGFDYQRNAEQLAEAVEKQEAASRDVLHWKALLEKTEEGSTRRYLEGLVKLSKLEALHHNLIARSCELAGEVQVVRWDHEVNAETLDKNPAGPVKPSSELTLIEKGRNKALAEYHARQAKAEAFSLLGERYRELGMEETARAYDDRARDVCISARGFGNVIQNYDKKIEDLRSAKLTKQVSPDLRNSFRTLEHAARYLDEYNSGSARVRNHTLCALESERRIQKLAGACARLPQSAVEHVLLKREADRGEKIKGLAEAEALDAGASYQNFRDAVESAEKTYDTISRALTGKPVELSKIKEPELDKPGLQVNGSDPNGAANPEHRQHGPGVGAVVSQILNEMDREI